MNIHFSMNTGRSPSARVDLSTLPAEHHERGARGAGCFLVAFSLVWGGVPTVILVFSLLRGEFSLPMLITLIFTVVGTGMLLFGLKLITTRKVLRFDPDQVSLDERSLFGRTEWSEPLSNYKGVRSWSEYHSGGKNRSSYTLHLIELHHDDPKRRVRLYQSRSADGVRTLLEDYCRKLNLPALEGEDGDLVARAADDLDKSVRDLARAGKLEVRFDPAQPPPGGITLRVEEGRLHLELPHPRISVPALFIPLLLGGVFMGFIPDLVFRVVGGLILLGVAAWLVWRKVAVAVVRVSPDAIHTLYRTRWGETRGTVLPAAGVESVRIGKPVQNTGRPGVVVVTDAQTVVIGAGLPRETLEWLRNCLLAVITR